MKHVFLVEVEIPKGVGILEMGLEIENAGGEDENHAWDGIRFNLVEDGWARNCTVQEFGQAGFVTQFNNYLFRAGSSGGITDKLYSNLYSLSKIYCIWVSS